MSGPDVHAALGRAAAVGPYFEVRLAKAGVDWRPLTELLDGDAAAERARFVRAALAQRAGAAVEPRVAASIHFLALASRLVAPPLATACIDGAVPRWSPGSLWWRAVDGGPVPLAVTAADGVAVSDAGQAARQLHAGVLGTVVEPLVTAFTRLSVSRSVLVGNVASALAGAARMLAGTPTLLDPQTVVAETLRHPPLAGAGGFGVDGRYFRRASCCLFYRVPGGGYCGDCVLG